MGCSDGENKTPTVIGTPTASNNPSPITPKAIGSFGARSSAAATIAP
jgi:hypothetical protein